jgi:hypothetical protein
MDTYLSKFAKKLLNAKFKNNTIMYRNEVLSHDGCDDDGYESNIYDLYMIVKNSSNQYDHYHFVMEDWFDQDRNTLEYTLNTKFTTPKFYKIETKYDIDPINTFYDIQKNSI